MVGFGVSNAMARIPASEIGALRTLLYRGICITLLQLVLLMICVPSVVTPYGLMLGIGVAIFAYFPVMFFYKALSLGRVGIVVPIANCSAVITTMLAVCFFTEPFTLNQGVSSLVIIIGILLISLNLKDFEKSDLLQLESGVPYALVACVLWGILFFAYKFPVSYIGPILTSFFVELGVMIMCFCHMKLRGESVSVPSGYFKYLIPIALFGVIAGVSYNIGISSSAISLVVMLYMASPLVSTLYARVFYQEKLSKQQYVGVAFSILGLIGVSILR